MLYKYELNDGDYLMANPACRLPPVDTKVTLIIHLNDKVYLVDTKREMFAKSYDANDIGHVAQNPIPEELQKEFPKGFGKKPWFYTCTVNEALRKQYMFGLKITPMSN